MIGDLLRTLKKIFVRINFTIYYINITKLSTCVDNFVDNFIERMFYYANGQRRTIEQSKRITKD